MCLVPELESHGMEAAAEGENGNLLEHGVLIVGSLEVVVGNSRVEMVDVNVI